MRILILGVNGFIGHALATRILAETEWEVAGMDLGDDRIRDLLPHPRMRFLEGDLSIHREWIEYHVKRSDVVLPLVAIATPATYVQQPLRVFELDFEENLRIIRYAARYDTRVVFPSTSEVYGMCSDAAFREDTSPLVMGPIHKQRWIYACAKQLLDRVIWAYGQQEGLHFTLFRPFNWIGPNLDDVYAPKEGSSRVVTQFLGNLLRQEPLRLVDGGVQRRSFTYIDDGIDGLMRIIENRNGCAEGRIFNLGNPANDCSISELAMLMIEILAQYPGWENLEQRVQTEQVAALDYYGEGYQDIATRVPDITNARTRLGWEPRFDLREAVAQTIAYYAKGENPLSRSR
jgi:nucleoside-diphosphate-sugar epimerase